MFKEILEKQKWHHIALTVDEDGHTITYLDGAADEGVKVILLMAHENVFPVEAVVEEIGPPCTVAGWGTYCGNGIYVIKTFDKVIPVA